eukprot:gene35789-46440_t
MSSKEKPTHNCFSQFFLQLRVVMWKNATLKLRFWYILLLELIIPAGFMLALVGIRASISSKTIDAYVPSIPTKFNPSFKDLYRSPDCGGENLIWRCVLKKSGPTCPNLCQPKRIAIAPSSGSSAIEAQNLADWAKFYIDIGPLPLSSEPTSWFTYFNSESDFLSYIDRDGYGFDNSIPIYSAAIILNSGYPAWDYSIRMNKTVTNTAYRSKNNALNAPSTDTPATDESLLYAKQIPGNSSFATYSEMFTDIGYFALTDLMNSYISTRTCQTAAAFTFGTLAFAEYEDNQIGITQFTINKSNKYQITFADTLGLLVVDTLYLLVLSWYLAHVMPSEFGTPKKWYFCFLPSYWLPNVFRNRNNHHNGRETGLEQVNTADDEDCPVEGVTENLASQKTNSKCVEIIGLRKEFQTNTGLKVAVDGLNLTMYNGQITALLGHNGAGKSTAIAMLTGLIPSDGGVALVEGLNMNTDMGAIRSIIGVCPQHDILFPELTVEEHLSMFATFKGCPYTKLKAEVEKMIQSVGLTEKRKVYTKFLSGGQKRKLSVAIAFIGDSRVVFLDEPTSGMDPYSRRFTWNVIRQHREGRTVVLTTHFMDEADLLGDRIAIMGDGKLRCCGSSLFLKQKFGVGYSMTLEKKEALNFNTARLTSMITSNIPDAKLLTDVGTEISFQLPFNASSKFQKLFEAFDTSLDELGLRSYGMSVTTLEEVFLKVAEGTSTLVAAEKGRGTSTGSSGNVPGKSNKNRNKIFPEDDNATKKAWPLDNIDPESNTAAAASAF